MMLIFLVTIVVFAMYYLGPYRQPGWVTPGFSILLFTLGLAAIGSGEFIREAVRKPYIAYDVVFSNQIYKEELPKLRAEGYLEGGVWTKAWTAERHPEAIGPDGRIELATLSGLPAEERHRLGAVLFQYHCNDCHSAEAGYSAVAHLTRGWTPGMVRQLVLHPERAHFFMPPWAGTAPEAELLQEYLVAISEPFPKGLPDLGGPPDRAPAFGR